MDHTLEMQVTAAVIDPILERRRALYFQTSNPIHAWRAFATARKWNIVAPDWVLTYLDECASALAKPHRSAKSIADALGLGSRGGPTVVQRARTDERDLEIVERIAQLQKRPTRAELKRFMKEHGLTGDVVDPGDRTELDIRTQVAEEFRLSIERINAIATKLLNPPKSKR